MSLARSKEVALHTLAADLAQQTAAAEAAAGDAAQLNSRLQRAEALVRKLEERR